MKLKTTTLFLALTSLVVFNACKENAKNTTKETKKELVAENHYQCPMDCEDGKTYTETGSCPVCKMDLKMVTKDTAMTCSVHKDGNCSCDGDTCACDNCPEHSKAMTCTVHKDGECSCEGETCACANCPEHS